MLKNCFKGTGNRWILQFAMNDHRYDKFGLEHWRLKMMSLQLITQFFSREESKCPGISFHNLLQIKEKIIEDVGASFIRIFNDNGLPGHTTHFLNQSLPSVDVRQETEGHDHIKLFVLKRKIQAVAGNVLKTALIATAIQPCPTDIRAAGNGHCIAIVYQRHGELRMATTHIQNGGMG